MQLVKEKEERYPPLTRAVLDVLINNPEWDYEKTIEGALLAAVVTYKAPGNNSKQARAYFLKWAGNLFDAVGDYPKGDEQIVTLTGR